MVRLWHLAAMLSVKICASQPTFCTLDSRNSTDTRSRSLNNDIHISLCSWFLFFWIALQPLERTARRPPHASPIRRRPQKNAADDEDDRDCIVDVVNANAAAINGWRRFADSAMHPKLPHKRQDAATEVPPHTTYASFTNKACVTWNVPKRKC